MQGISSFFYWNQMIFRDFEEICAVLRDFKRVQESLGNVKEFLGDLMESMEF